MTGTVDTPPLAPGPASPVVDPARLRRAMDALTARSLRPIWPALAAIYAFFAVSHLAILPPRLRWPLFTLAAATSAFFAVGTFAMRGRRFGGPTATRLGALTALLVWLNSAVHLFLSGEPRQSTNLGIVLVGAAMFILDRRWFGGIAGLSLGTGFLAFALNLEDPDVLHFAFSLVSFTVLAGLIHLIRVHDLRRIEGLLMVEEQREARLKAALEEARYRLASIWENSREGMVISDADGRLVAVNHATTRLLDRPETELTGRLWTDFLGANEDTTAAGLAYAAAFAHPESAPAEEREVTLASGRRAWVTTTHAHLPQADGRPLLLTLIRDVTERRRLDEERLRLQRHTLESQRLDSLGMLAGGIAHDFNNLLTIILGYLEFASEAPESAGVRRELNLASDAAQRAATLCRQMLAYAGRGPLLAEPGNLNHLILETKELLLASLPKDHRLEFDLAPNLPGLHSDPSQIRQVIMNLVINAAEAMAQRRGTVQVRTRLATPKEAAAAGPDPSEPPPQAFLCLEVRDEGCGMSAEIQARIFEPFYTTKFTGRGLGLAAVLGIVRAHHGSIAVESQPGRGSLFRVVLPALDQPVVPPPTAAAPPTQWRGSGTVLVIDDEPHIRDLASRQLSVLGFDSLTASDGREGLEILGRHHDLVRLILLDLTMPRMDGQQVLKSLHDWPQPPPVILMSGYAQREVERRLTDEPLAGYLEKPFTFEQLADRVRLALEPSPRPTP